MAQGASYTATVSSDYSPDDNVAIWIDFDDNHTFTAAERVAAFDDLSITGSAVTLTIPAGAALGRHGMRVMVGYDIPSTSLDPCNSGINAWDYGETHDYTALIVSSTGLAIKMKDITGENKGTANFIKWATLEETKGDYFILQRSTDGKNFLDIQTVNAIGKANSYSYTDDRAATGINYYRLQLHHVEGNIATAILFP